MPDTHGTHIKSEHKTRDGGGWCADWFPRICGQCAFAVLVATSCVVAPLWFAVVFACILVAALDERDYSIYR